MIKFIFRWAFRFLILAIVLVDRLGGRGEIRFGSLLLACKERFEFRAESFNLSNTPYFGGVNTAGSNPGNNLGTPTFGVITDATGERQVQFSLKVIW